MTMICYVIRRTAFHRRLKVGVGVAVPDTVVSEKTVAPGMYIYIYIYMYVCMYVCICL